nr:MAG: RNA-dependent RNA polymerase [Picobirnavirus dog/KNA/2015]
MPKNSETSFGYYFEMPNPGLMSYFGNVEKGQPNIYDTPFAKGESTKDLLQGWLKELESIRDEWPSLWEFENDLAKKVGPMSVMKPLQDRLSDIDAYYEGILLPSEPLSHAAIAAVVSEWRNFRGLRVRNQNDTLSKMKLSTNSGSPYFRKRRVVIKDTVPCAVYISGQHVTQVLGGHADIWQACAVLGWRGQEGGPLPTDVKQRVVWMFPFAVNIRELQVYQPLIEVAQRGNLVPAWVSMDSVDDEITKLFDSKGDKDLIVCTDFTKFDQHFNPDMQDAAKAILQGILSPSASSRDWLDEVFPIKYMIPLAYDKYKIRYGKHGMGSGSGGTNADETLAHRALQYEAAQSVGARLNPHSMCLGDDGILSYPGITVDDVVNAYTRHGLEMNQDKQYASTQDCVYLRRWHHKNYRINGVCAGVYATTRALGRLRYLERFMDPRNGWGPKMVALRQLSIIENVKYHPMRTQFVDYCMKRDKFRLGLDIPGFLDNIEAEAKKAIDSMPDFLGYTKTLQNAGDDTGGIADWWIVKYLKSM